MPKILLVDDYDETLESLSMIYGLYSDIEVVGTAHNSEELWAGLDSGDVNIVSLDIQLGREDGLDLCARIHEKYPEIFIVICSLEASNKNRRVAEEAGASMFLAKPVSKNDVAEILKCYRSMNDLLSRPSAPKNDWMKDLLGSL